MDAEQTDLQQDAGFDSGIDSEVSTTAFIHDPVLEKYQTPEYQDKWKKEIEASRNERKRFVKKGYQIIEHWGDIRPSDNTRSNYNLLFANTELKLAATYAQTPCPDVARRFSNPNDQIGRVAALMVQRALQTELDGEDFDTTMRLIVMDRLLPGVGIGWVRLEQQGGEDYFPYANQTIMDAAGNEVPHPMAQQVAQTPVTGQSAPIDHVSWDDFYWSPCRTWKLCRWMARHIPMSKEAVEERFGTSAPKEVLSQLSYGSKEEEGIHDNPDADKQRTKHQLEKTTSIFEIWDKELGLVWWVSEMADVPLDVQEDANNFPGFFPTPRTPLARVNSSNTLPIPDYHFTQDLYRRADELNNRAARMEQAAQVKFVYDNAFPQLRDLLTTESELGGIGVDNWQTFTGEKGGLNNAIQFLPIQEMVQAAETLTQELELVEAQILKIEGLSGPFQAESAPNETVLQTQQKAAFGTSRLSITQKDVAKYVQELLRLKAHLMCKFYTDEEWMKRVGTLTRSDQQLIPQALALLRNEQLMNFDLTVSVDSIQLPNWNLEKQEKTEAFTAIMQALSQILPAVEQNPALAPLALKSVEWLITGFKGAQYMEGEIDMLLQQMAMQQQQQGQQPKPPNPKQIEAQIAEKRMQTDVHVANIEAQTKRMETEKQMQVDQAKLVLKAREQTIQEEKNLITAHHNALTGAHNQALDLTNAAHEHAIALIGVPKP
jgi:hypothetical protein